MSPIECFSPDLVRFSFLIGMILSVCLYEKSHITTGSIVVPGFLGTHVFDPGLIAVSVLNAWICFTLIHQLLPRILLTSTNTKFQSLILASVALQLVFDLIVDLPSEIALAGNTFRGFGYVIPGLIAHDMSRNGPGKTAGCVLATSYSIGSLVFLSVWFCPESSLNLQPKTVAATTFDLPLLLVLSTFGSVVIKSKTSFRSGGYITAAYFVFFNGSPVIIAAIMVVSLITYLVCCRLLIPWMIIFGRRKFALVLIVGTTLMWTTSLIVGTLGIPLPYVDHPSHAALIVLLPGLIANDMQRSSIPRVCFGLGLLCSWVLVVAGLFHEITHFSRPQIVIPLVGLLGSSALCACWFQRRVHKTANASPLPYFPMNLERNFH